MSFFVKFNNTSLRKGPVILYRLFQLTSLAMLLLMTGAFGCSGMMGGGISPSPMQAANSPGAQDPTNPSNEGSSPPQNAGSPEATVTLPSDTAASTAMDRRGGAAYNPNIFQGTEGGVGSSGNADDFYVNILPPPVESSKGDNFTPTVDVRYFKELNKWDLEETYTQSKLHLFCEGGGRAYSANYIEISATDEVKILDLGFTSVTQHYKSCPLQIDCSEIRPNKEYSITLQLDPPNCL